MNGNGTTDNNKAKEMDQKLGQGDPLNELIDIDEESLISLIPEADYIIDNIPNEDEDIDNTIENLGINNLLDFLVIQCRKPPHFNAGI